MTYQIITDATADLNDELLAGLPEVRIIPMYVEVGGREYLFGPGGNIDCDEFYGYLRSMVAARFPDAEIHIAPIGPVIGAHAGPGVMTVFFWGNHH